MEQLSLVQKLAWSSFLVGHHVVARKIDRAMMSANVASLETYNLLLLLECSPNRRLRMAEIAENLVSSKSGLTRFVDKLELQGLIVRESNMNDRRSIYAVITDKGIAERERAWPVYQQAIYEYFAALYSEEELRLLDDMVLRLTDGTTSWLRKDLGATAKAYKS